MPGRLDLLKCRRQRHKKMMCRNEPKQQGGREDEETVQKLSTITPLGWQDGFPV